MFEKVIANSIKLTLAYKVREQVQSSNNTTNKMAVKTKILIFIS